MVFSLCVAVVFMRDCSLCQNGAIIEQDYSEFLLYFFGNDEAFFDEKVHLCFLVDVDFLAFQIDCVDWLRQKQESAYQRWCDFVQSFLLNNFYQDIARLSKIVLHQFKEIFLVFSQIKEGTIFLKPSLSSRVVIFDGYWFGTVEDNRHIFIKFRQVIDRLSVELLLIKQEKREEWLDWFQLLQHRNMLVPLDEKFSSLFVTNVA